MFRRSPAALTFLATLAIASSAHADDEPPIGPTGPPPPAPPVVAPSPANPPPAPTADPDVVGPPRPPPDAPLPPEPPETSDAITPRPIEQPIEPEPELVPPRFGAAGQVVLMSEFGLDVTFTGYSSSGASRFGASFQPSFEIFVVKNLSLGASLFASYSNTRLYGPNRALIDESYTAFGAAPRIGYAIPLDRWVTLYPRVAFGMVHVEDKTSLAPGSVTAGFVDGFTPASGEKTLPYVYVIAPFLIHPSSSFFLGAGPSIYAEIGDGRTLPSALNQRTNVSFETVVGGYWGGAPVPLERAGYPLSGEKKAKRHRFGDRNDVLFSGDFYLGVSSTSNAETKTTYNSVSVSPAFDYFVEDHVSLGFGLGFDHSKGIVGSGKTSRTFETSNGAHVFTRIGVQATLAERLSLYPRAFFRFNYDDVSATTSYTLSSLRVGLELPFVFHAAPHFYIGCGPFVGHDVARYENGTSSDVLSTSGGVSTTVGGWL